MTRAIQDAINKYHLVKWMVEIIRGVLEFYIIMLLSSKR